jgi:hypothetical protein
MTPPPIVRPTTERARGVPMDVWLQEPDPYDGVCFRKLHLSNVHTGDSLAAVEELAQIAEAARAFIETMGGHYSQIEQRSVFSRFTSGSSAAAQALADALGMQP